MSNPYRRPRSLSGLQASDRSLDDLRALFRQILRAGIHGLSFSPYVGDQGPGSVIDENQVRDRLEVIRPYVGWIRSFSCTDGNDLIPGLAREMGLRTMVGVWLDDNRERNELELTRALNLARDGVVDILAVGNEVLLREELSEQELLEYIRRARQAAPGVTVGYVDAYFKFVDHPAITQACDLVLANCYPFWESCPLQYSLVYMKEMYRQAQAAAGGKPVIISETGWPSIGTPCDEAVPSVANAITYFVNTYQWAAQEAVEIFYFSAFDEGWKVADEGDVGAYWGLWDKDGACKYA